MSRSALVETEVSAPREGYVFIFRGDETLVSGNHQRVSVDVARLKSRLHQDKE